MHSLWFGTDAEKLTLLVTLSTGEKWRNVAESQASHNRVFDILALPGATQEHEAAAAFIALRSGMSRVATTPAIYPRFNHWHQLGKALAAAWPKYPNEQTIVLNAQKFLRSQPPEISVPLITRVIHEELTADMRRNSLGSLFWKPGHVILNAVTVDISNVYTALADWLPQYRQQWEAAASLGLPVAEAGSMILSTLADSGVGLELPVDMGIA